MKASSYYAAVLATAFALASVGQAAPSAREPARILKRANADHRTVVASTSALPMGASSSSKSAATSRPAAPPASASAAAPSLRGTTTATTVTTRTTTRTRYSTSTQLSTTTITPSSAPTTFKVAPSRSSSSSPSASSPSSPSSSTSSSASSSPSSTTSSGSSDKTALEGFFFGANSYYLHALQDDDRIAVLDAMKGAGMSVVRIFISHVGQNNKNSGNDELNDLEGWGVGDYDDTVLEKIDQLMVELQERNMQLIISIHDRYALGFWDTDQYAYKYGIVSGGSGAQRISDASNFYTDGDAISNMDKRIAHVMQHKNKKLNSTPWAKLDSVIYAIEPQNEPMGHMDLVSDSWNCGRAAVIRKYLPSGSGIKISTGGGITIETSIADWAYSCDNFDIISVHDYGTDAWATAATLDTAQQKAWNMGKTLVFEEWGALGDNKASIIADFAQALKSYNIPWLYWEIVKPGKGSSDFEVWTDEDSWGVLGDGSQTGAINWSKKNKSRRSLDSVVAVVGAADAAPAPAPPSSEPALEVPTTLSHSKNNVVRGRRIARGKRQHHHHKQTHPNVRRVVRSK